MVIVGVMVGVIDIVGVMDGVIEIVGVLVIVGVTVGVFVRVGVGVTVDVCVGVSDIVGVTVHVTEGVGVTEAVGDGVAGITGATTLSRLLLAMDPCPIIRFKDNESLRNLTFSLCKSLLLGGLGIIKNYLLKYFVLRAPTPSISCS
jgi:hypothetical protein